MPKPGLRSIDDLPGPRGLPLLGHALQLQSPQVHQVVEGWAREYGALFRFRLGRRRFIGMADHEMIAGVMRAPADTFGRSSRMRQALLEMQLPLGVFASNGEAWERQRRMVMAGFDPAHIRAYFPSMLSVVQRLERRWQQAAESGSEIRLKSDLMRFTVDTVSGLAFGADVNTLESDGDVIQQHLDQMLPGFFRRLMAPVPYWRYLKLPAERRFENSLRQVGSGIVGFIAQARQRLADDPARRRRPANVLEAMLVAADTPGSGIRDDEVVGTVINLLIAGEDTTAHSIAWLLWLLHRHPAALAEARAEVRRQAGDLARIDLDQLASLDHLDACIHESMRLKPVAPVVMREALRDTVVGDIAVPKGTLIWFVMRHGGQDSKLFPEPERFEPQRWRQGAAQEAGPAKRISMPFGGGARICPGRYLALVEIKLVLAMLLGRFEIEHVAPADGGEVRETMALTMFPNDLRMRLRPAVP